MGAEARTAMQRFQAVTEEALDDAGYVLTHKDAVVAGNVNKVDTAGEAPVGVNFMSTKNPVTGVATADVKVAILDEGDAWVKLEPNATRAEDIVVDDYIQGSDNGMAIFLDDLIDNVADIDKVIGISRQEVANGVDLPTAGEKPYKTGYLLVKLCPRMC